MYSYVDRCYKMFFIVDSFQKYSYLAYILLPYHDKDKAYLIFAKAMRIQANHIHLEFMF